MASHFSMAELLTWQTPALPRGTWQPAPAAAAANRASLLANTTKHFVRLAGGPSAGSDPLSGAPSAWLVAGREHASPCHPFCEHDFAGASQKGTLRLQPLPCSHVLSEEDRSGVRHPKGPAAVLQPLIPGSAVRPALNTSWGHTQPGEQSPDVQSGDGWLPHT